MSEPGAGQMPSHSLAAVVPVLNEATAIGALVAELKEHGACCVFVVDSGSDDGTQEIAAAAGAVVVPEPRRGYGRACLSGADRAVASGHSAICFLDGDGSCDPADLPVLAAGLANADVVLGRRRSAGIEPGALPWHARAGNAVVAALLSARTGRRVHDLPPFKCFRQTALSDLGLDDARYGWTVQAVARSLADGRLRVVERPARFRRRMGGRSKVSGSIRSSFAAGWAMLRVAWAETHRRPALAMTAKAPRDGHAKTRLAVDIGTEATLSLWAACLADGGASLAAAGRQARAGALLAIVPAAQDREPVRRLLGPAWSVLVQQRAGLSGALVDTFLAAFDRGAESAIIIGADSPTLPARIVDSAVRALGNGADAVLGPCADGGYYLIGLRFRRSPPLVSRVLRQRLAARLERCFDRVSMGGPDALSGTHAALAEAGWRAALLEPWIDLDTGADLAGLISSVREDPCRFPQVGVWLRDHGRVVSSWAKGVGSAVTPPGGTNATPAHPPL